MRRKHVLNQRRLPCLPHQCMYGVSAYYNCEHWLVPRLDQGVDRGRHDRTPWLDYQLHSSDTSMTPYHCRSSAHQRYLLVWLCLSSAAAAVAEAQHDPFQPCHFPDFDGAVQRFSKALTYKTLSDAKAKDHVVDPSQFAELDAHLSQAYAQVWQQLQVEKLGAGNHSYLITWRGSNPALKPALFISHVDVVPVSPGTEQDWTHPPFGGAVADGFIWGRGTLDLKVSALGLLEAAAALLAEGYQPQRTLLLAFGNDEEVGGAAGAGQIAAKLKAEGQQLEFIWDEGGIISAQGMPPFTHMPVALVATAEKYYQSVSVTIHSPGGHSSMPDTDQTSVAARLGALLTALTASPPAVKLVSPTREFVQGLADLSPPWLAVPLRLLKLLPSGLADKLVANAMAYAPASASFVRDTAALTLLQAGVADNVLPQTARLSINFRLLPGTPVSDTLAHVRRWLGANAAHANISLGPTACAPSSVTDHKGLPFQLVKQAIQETWRFSEVTGAGYAGSGVPVLPYLMPGGTDSKHYQNLTDSILRFCPYSLSQKALSTVHGTDEKISLRDFERLLCTYRAGLRLAGGGGPAAAGASGEAAGTCSNS